MLEIGRTTQIGNAVEPGCYFPKRAVPILQGLSGAIAEGDRDESEVGRPKQPAVDLFQMGSSRTMGGPGAQDELTFLRSKPPETRPAVTAPTPERFKHGQWLHPNGIPLEDLVHGSRGSSH